MQRQHSELVPIGEVVSGLPGPFQALRRDPPARHHFTVADQVDQLVAASETDPERGFMARTMALCSLPRRNPGNRLQYKRANGRLYSEVQFALPKELSAAGRREAAARFAGQLTGPERLPYTLALHRGGEAQSLPQGGSL